MEPTTSNAARSLAAPPGGVPPGRLLFPPQPTALRWLLPAVVVHLVALLLLVALPRRPVAVERPLPMWAIVLSPPAPAEPSYPELPPPPAAIRLPAPARAVERVVVAPAPGEAPSAPPISSRPAPAEARVGAAPAPAGADTSAAGAPVSPFGARPRLPVVERLRPGHGDPRLWQPLPEDIVGLSNEQLMQLELDLAIAEVVDSVRAAEAAGRRATDWTYVDSKGRRWGVSPGQIHLGGLTIPLPFGFSAPRTAEAMRVAQQDAEIERQAVRQGTQGVLRDRAAEIRRRRDAERARAAAASAASRPKGDARPRADTTGGE